MKIASTEGPESLLSSDPSHLRSQKIVKLDLDMRQLTDGSLHGQVLEFTTEIRTRSVNRGTREIKSSLTLQSEAFLSLNGLVYILYTREK